MVFASVNVTVAQKMTSLSSAVDAAPTFIVAGNALVIASVCEAVGAGRVSVVPDFD